MRMKIAVGFVHTLIIMKILVLSCALHCKRSRDGQSIGSREVFGRVSRAEGQQEL